jgi:signal transduction histidine kinase
VKSIRQIWEDINRHVLIVDGAIAAVFTGLALLNLLIAWQVFQPVHISLAIALTVIATAPLVLRRRFPLTVLLITTAIVILYRLLDIPEGTITAYAVLLALFGAGAFGSPRWRTSVRGICVAGVGASLTYLLFLSDQSWGFSYTAILGKLLSFLFNVFLFGAAWWIGDVFRNRLERESELRIQTVQLEEEREENARRAVLDERVRIARELHDVVAHHVSLMGVQAGAARRVLSQQPEKAQD